MAYSINLSAEILELKRLRRNEKDGKRLRRYQCVWMAHKQFSKKEIASVLSVNIDTVTDWVKLFNKSRLAGLSAFHYEGRRPSVLDSVKEVLVQHIRQASVSKLSELQDFLKTNHSITVEHSWLSRYCKKNFIALIKNKTDTGESPTPQIQQAFIEVMDQLYSCARSDTKEVLLYLDPMHQIHNNENDYSWQPTGSQGTKKVLANTGRRRLNIIGAINAVSLEPTIMLTEANCSAEVIEAFLEEVKKQYTNATTICIILDNATYQRSYAVQQKAKALDMELLYLPPYSPNLNLIERLWRYFKKKVMKNRYYESYAVFEKAVETFFQAFADNIPELKSLLNFKFGIIKTN